MDQLARRHLENRLRDARKSHAAEVAELRRHLRHLDDAEYSSAAWRNIATTAAQGSFYAGQVDALTVALAADDASNANPKE